MKIKMLRSLFFSLAAAFAVTSCNLDDGTEYVYQEVAYGYIGNASPNSGDLYFFADANQVNMNSLNFGSANGYYRFYPGTRTLSIRNQSGTVLDSEEITLGTNDYFTAFAVNTADNIELAVYEDELAYPAAGKALVRFINLSPDSGGIEISYSGNEVASALEFREATAFVQITAGTSYTFQYRLAPGNAPIYEQTLSLQPGRIYTVYTKGFAYPTPGNNDGFSAETIHNY